MRMNEDDSAAMLGRYRIEGRIGEGAMADVFRARDPDIGRTVAIKVLKPQYRRDAELGARFVREARAAGALTHAGIATIYDVGEADGVPYIAMELVDGRPLDSVLETSGRMPYERVLALGVQLARALGYAHAQGVVHRDVKPSNILLSTDGRVAKLLDFGVARVGDVDVTAADAEMAKTQVGQLIGTPRYMSPEQALGLPTTPRSDLFSLGTVLYEMVAGKPAFGGTGLAQLAIQIAQEAPPPIERAAADCPPGLRFIIEKLMAKKPEQRFSDGEQLALALERELTAATTERPMSRRGLPLRFKLPLILVTVTALALFVSVGTVLSRQRAALEQMAIVSGGSIAAFVTNNAAVRVVDNAGLPADQQDWAPLQAFVTTAAQDDGIGALVVADTGGVVRAASDEKLVGTRYRPASAENIVANAGGARVSDAATGGGGMRFVRPIRYAGADFGTVDLVVRRTTLDAAIDASRMLLFGLAGVVMLVALGVGYLSGASVARPLRRLQQSIDEAAQTDFALRISHRRRDEFGAVFDAFNRLAAAVGPRIGISARAAEQSVAATRVAPSRMAA